MAPDEEPRTIEDTDFRPGDGTVVRVKILTVPESEKFEDGVKYRLHYGTEDGATIVRYDNSQVSMNATRRTASTMITSFPATKICRTDSGAKSRNSTPTNLLTHD